MRILAVCGSLRARSSNRRLLQIAGTFAPTGVQIVPFEGLGSLPLFDPDLEAAPPPPAVEAWRRALAGADAVLFASPEYGHSLPGGLKNAIDWVVGSGELHRKIVAITAAVPQGERGRLGLSALAQTLAAVDAVLVWREPTVLGPGLAATIGDVIGALVSTACQARCLPEVQ